MEPVKVSLLHHTVFLCPSISFLPVLIFHPPAPLADNLPNNLKTYSSYWVGQDEYIPYRTTDLLPVQPIDRAHFLNTKPVSCQNCLIGQRYKECGTRER